MKSLALKPNVFVLAGAAVIGLTVFIVYFPSLNGGFIWDDELFVTKNQITKSSDGLYRFWCTTESIDYWPVCNSTFWIEWRLWGMNSTGYHVTNLLLHIATALMIWIILRKLSIPGAFLAAIIFAVHPVNVESVAWIAQRKNLTSMLFLLMSVLWYLKLEMPPQPSQNQFDTDKDRPLVLAEPGGVLAGNALQRFGCGVAGAGFGNYLVAAEANKVGLPADRAFFHHRGCANLSKYMVSKA